MQYTVLSVYKVEFKGLTGMLKKISCILGLSFWELLMFPPHRMSGGICLTGFWILRQDFWAHHVISISNHREPLPPSLHTQELPFYQPNNSNGEIRFLFLPQNEHLYFLLTLVDYHTCRKSNCNTERLCWFWCTFFVSRRYTFFCRG